MNGNKVIVVMPAYNAEKTLEKTFRDIPEGTVHEEILVDDASRDGSFDKLHARLIEKLKKPAKHWIEGIEKRVKIIRNEKQMGTAQCRRLAIAAASGDIYVLWDGHMRAITPFSVERMAFGALDKGGVIVAAVTGIGQARNPKARWIYGGRVAVKDKWGMLNSHINTKPDERYARRNSNA